LYAKCQPTSEAASFGIFTRWAHLAFGEAFHERRCKVIEFATGDTIATFKGHPQRRIRIPIHSRRPRALLQRRRLHDPEMGRHGPARQRPSTPSTEAAWLALARTRARLIHSLGFGRCAQGSRGASAEENPPAKKLDVKEVQQMVAASTLPLPDRKRPPQL